MIQKTKKAWNDMVEKQKKAVHKHKDMLGVHIFLALIVGVFLHMLFPPKHTASQEMRNHGAAENQIIEHREAIKKAQEEENKRVEETLQTLLESSDEKFRTIPSSLTAPDISLKFTEDPEEGWKMFLGIENFAFTPKRVGLAKETDYFEGHATLYINDKYVSRIYGPYFHIPEHFLKEGKNNLILVTLNDNNHRTFKRHDEILYDAEMLNLE